MEHMRCCIPDASFHFVDAPYGKSYAVVNRYHTWVEMNEIRSEAVCKTYHRKKKYPNRHLFFALENAQSDKNDFTSNELE